MKQGILRTFRRLVILGLIVCAALPSAITEASEITHVWSTYLGGYWNDMGWGIACGRDGSVYAIGETRSYNFPTTEDAFDPTHNGITDGCLSRISADGSRLLYGTFLGSGERDVCRDIALDAEGNIYLTGPTNSPDFPVTPDAPDTTFNNWHDAYVVKLDPSGHELLFGTYIGGSLRDKARGLVLLGPDRVAITGFTESADFPVTPDAFDTSHNGDWDVFVTILDLAAGEITYSTFLGGLLEEEPWDLAADDAGNLYVTGYTGSSDYPVVLQSYDPGYNGRWDVFVTKLDPTLSELRYSTYIGGYDYDRAWRMVVNGSGEAIITGHTESPDFPVTPGAYDQTFNGDADVFVTKLSATGCQLVFSTFLGANHGEFAKALTVDEAGYVYVSGSTYSSLFPVVGDVPGPAYSGGGDLFLSMFCPHGCHLVASSFLGGSRWEEAYGLAVHTTGDLLVTGITDSYDYPATFGAFDEYWNGGDGDVFVSRLRFETAFQHAPEGGVSDLPAGATLRLAVRPQPLCPASEVELHLAAAGPLAVDLCDVSGARVRSLISGWQAAGTLRLAWGDLAPAHLPNGCYFLRAAGPGAEVARRVIVTR